MAAVEEHASHRPASSWLRLLRQRRQRIHEEKLDLSVPVEWDSPEEQKAAVAFFNAAFRAEESGLRQAHDIAGEVATWDPELAKTLRLYGDEEGWHRELLTEFIAYLGGGIKPMGPTTRTFCKLYARAEKHETIVLTNLMFETIGANTPSTSAGCSSMPTTSVSSHPAFSSRPLACDARISAATTTCSPSRPQRKPRIDRRSSSKRSSSDARSSVEPAHRVGLRPVAARRSRIASQRKRAT